MIAWGCAVWGTGWYYPPYYGWGGGYPYYYPHYPSYGYGAGSLPLPTTVTVKEANGPTVQLSVKDDGIGIEPGTIERMFDPFTQADRTLARTQGGLGLGLALVKGLVELHGGTVEARSDGLGRGSEVVVRLPSAAASSELAAPAREGPPHWLHRPP